MAVLFDTLAADNGRLGTDDDGVFHFPTGCRYIIDKIDAVAFIRLRRPGHPFDWHRRIVRREGKAGMGDRIRIFDAIGIAEAGFV